MTTEHEFRFEDGRLFCEDVSIPDLIKSIQIHKTGANLISQEVKINQHNLHLTRVDVPVTPLFVYSLGAMQRNIRNYLEGIKKTRLNAALGYAMKANGNIHILRTLKDAGVQMLVTVSGNEILTGLAAGFSPETIIFNGNGKQSWEIKLAIEKGVLLNVDSVFDAERICKILEEIPASKCVKVLLRIRPSPSECSVAVHPYVNTSESSKFGFDIMNELDKVLSILQSSKVEVHGIHCHLGSCIYDLSVYTDIARLVSDVSKRLAERGIVIQLLDIGGGIGINYHAPLPGQDSNQDENNKRGNSTCVPNILQFLEAIATHVPSQAKIVIEPGRSLIGNTAMLICSVLGSKQVKGTSYAVVDAAMTDLIRPCLYGAHHQIVSTVQTPLAKWQNFDVVGPVCETADFLGKDISLPLPLGEHLAILDCGAYAFAMASNYNMRPRAEEIIVNGKTWACIRKRETFEDLMSKMTPELSYEDVDVSPN